MTCGQAGHSTSADDLLSSRPRVRVALKARRVLFTNPATPLTGRALQPPPVLPLDDTLRTRLLGRLDQPGKRADRTTETASPSKQASTSGTWARNTSPPRSSRDRGRRRLRRPGTRLDGRGLDGGHGQSGWPARTAVPRGQPRRTVGVAGRPGGCRLACVCSTGLVTRFTGRYGVLCPGFQF
jgi:hypothetical protein